MSDSTIIDQVAMERILYAIEESLQVMDRSRFNTWAQGALQGLLPHETLLCAYGDLASFRFSCKTFSAVAEHHKISYRLTDPAEGLLNSIIDTWLSSGRKPLFYAAGTDAAVEDPTAAKLRLLGFGYAMAHGAREIANSEGSFFLFLQMPDAPKPSHGYFVDLLMPHLHMAVYRMLRAERESGMQEVAAKNVLSGREEEVLRWVGQGKTNQEIGELLGISALTVKNHLQKILRKLRVSNRAQAVFKANLARPITGQYRKRAKAAGTK